MEGEGRKVKEGRKEGKTYPRGLNPPSSPIPPWKISRMV
jgi:hypothetical protein